MIAAVVGVVALIAVVSWLASPSSPPTAGNKAANAQDNSSDGQDPTAGHSKSYQDGYWFTYHNQYRVAGASFIGMSPHAACQLLANSEAPVRGANTAEFAQGCEAALIKLNPQSPPSGPSSPGSIDCSKPVEGNDNGFHAINCPP
jgi:hypothetical protein